MSVERYNNERRTNPEILAKVEKLVEDRKAMLLKAAAGLKEIVDEMRPLVLTSEDRIYSRCFDAAWKAYSAVSGDAEFMKKIGGDIYTRNLAASELGAYFEEEIKSNT